MHDAPIRVLLVDDDEDEFLITKDLFVEMGRSYSLEWARSFEEALNEMRRDCRDAYLVDYHLGAHTGVELLREAKHYGCRAPMLILTGAGDRALDLEAMQAGAADYLDKTQLNAALLERSVRYAIERRRAEEQLSYTDAQRARLHELFVKAPAMVNIQLGPEHVFELVHPLMKELLGRDVTGLKLHDAAPELAEQGFDQLLDEVFRYGSVVTRKSMRLRVRGREIYFDVTLQPWLAPGGRVAGVMTFAVDVTEQALARRRIEEHVAALQVVERELSDAVRVRDEFLSVASHELKTPLTPLKLQLDQLQRTLRRNTAIDPSLLPLLETAKRQTNRLADLVESLLDVSALAVNGLPLHAEPMDLTQLAREVTDRFRPQAEAARSAIEVVGDAEVSGRWDRFRLEQVLSNLLSNAIKYGRGQPVIVEVAASGGNARVSVRDHGIGVAREDAARIFGRFERAVSSRHYGGLGLGLYIAHEIVEAHGGCILVDSEPARGSTFTVVLPLQPGARAMIEAAMHH